MHVSKLSYSDRQIKYWAWNIKKVKVVTDYPQKELTVMCPKIQGRNTNIRTAERRTFPQYDTTSDNTTHGFFVKFQNERWAYMATIPRTRTATVVQSTLDAKFRYTHMYHVLLVTSHNVQPIYM